jgi:hypothetical protein
VGRLTHFEGSEKNLAYLAPIALLKATSISSNFPPEEVADPAAPLATFGVATFALLLWRCFPSAIFRCESIVPLMQENARYGLVLCLDISPTSPRAVCSEACATPTEPGELKRKGATRNELAQTGRKKK